MKSLFVAASLNEVKFRLHRLTLDSPRQWGTLTPAAALAHCCGGVELAVGDLRPPRMLIGRVIGWVIKPLALRNDEPFRANTPTVEALIIRGNRDFEMERARLVGLIDRFVAGGPAGCTTHPHAFFGRLKPEEWGVLMYKHLDHHLRQFSV